MVISLLECAFTFDTPVTVVAESRSYKSVGEFRCNNNGVLFYLNDTKLVSKTTRCLATPQWENYENVYCATGE